MKWNAFDVYTVLEYTSNEFRTTYVISLYLFKVNSNLQESRERERRTATSKKVMKEIDCMTFVKRKIN